MQPGSTQTAAILITSAFTKLESENSLISICFSSCFNGNHMTRLLDQQQMNHLDICALSADSYLPLTVGIAVKQPVNDASVQLR